jgi:hypothetical protein
MTLMPEDNPLYHQAMQAVAAGNRVVPCGTDGKPLTFNGWKDATDNPQQVYLLWLVWQIGLVGIADDEEAEQ